MTAADAHRLWDLLGRLEEHWRRVDAPLARLARAGLSPEQIEAATARLGLRLPVEASIWFQWHDGSGDGVVAGASIGPRFELWSLELMVREYEEKRELLKSWVEDVEDPRLGWPRVWFPITRFSGGRSIVVVDCDVPVGSITGVGHVDMEANHSTGRVASVTDLVQYWVDCHDTGLYWWDPDRPGGPGWMSKRPGPIGGSPFGDFYH